MKMVDIQEVDVLIQLYEARESFKDNSNSYEALSEKIEKQKHKIEFTTKEV